MINFREAENFLFLADLFSWISFMQTFREDLFLPIGCTEIFCKD